MQWHIESVGEWMIYIENLTFVSILFLKVHAFLQAKHFFNSASVLLKVLMNGASNVA